MTLNIPNTFTAGTKAIASEVNENFDAVETAVNANQPKDLTSATNDIAVFNSTGSTVTSGKQFDDTGTTTNDIWSADKITSELDSYVSLVTLISKDYWSKISNNISAPTTDVDFGIGTQPDYTKAVAITLSSILTKELNSSWVEGTNNGGLASFLTLSANTTYHCFVISKADGTTDAGFDTSLTASNLLADATGYVYYRRIGSVITDSSANIIQFTEYNGMYRIEDVTSFNGTITTSASNTSLTVPAGIAVRPILNIWVKWGPGSGTNIVLGNTNLSPVTILSEFGASGVVQEMQSSNTFDNMVTSNATIDLTTDTLTREAKLYSQGWFDLRND